MRVPRPYLYDAGIFATVIAMVFLSPLFQLIGAFVLGLLAFLTTRIRRIEAVRPYSPMVRLMLVLLLLGCVTAAYFFQR